MTAVPGPPGDLFGMHERDKAVVHNPPVAGGKDPITSWIAARRIGPFKRNRRELVFDLFWSRRGQWLRVPDFANPAIGGGQGDRRMRELRQAGLAIESKPDPDSKTAWLYRIPEWWPEGPVDPAALLERARLIAKATHRRARDLATERLIANHEDEYATLVDEAMGELGDTQGAM